MSLNDRYPALAQEMLAETLIDILERLRTVKPGTINGRKRMDFPLANLSGGLVLDETINDITREVEGGFFRDCTWQDVGMRCDTGIWNIDPKDGKNVPSLFAYRAPAVLPARVFRRLGVEIRTVSLVPDGMIAMRDLIGTNDFKNWDLIRKDGTPLLRIPSGERSKREAQRVALIPALQFSHDLQWRVGFTLPGVPEAQLETDPEGAKSVFRLRDIPDGARRRKALVHWVAQHRRRQGRGDGSKLIASYLRGETTFKWHDMICRIVPSASDVRRYKAQHDDADPAHLRK
jgi:hypothetical protein